MRIADLIFPPRCVCCSAYLPYDGAHIPFCESCLTKWELAKNRCAMIGAGQPMFVFDKELYESGRGGYVLYLTDYVPKERGSAVNRLILGLKDHPTLRLAGFAASELAAMVRRGLPLVTAGGACHESAVISWIPRRLSHRLIYGADHMERVAGLLAKELELPASRLIGRRLISSEQKRLTAEERRLNAERSFVLAVSRDELCGKTVILIDDIVTSGASLETASKLLTDGGATQVIAMTLARTDSTAMDDFNFIKNT